MKKKNQSNTIQNQIQFDKINNDVKTLTKNDSIFTLCEKNNEDLVTKVEKLIIENQMLKRQLSGNQINKYKNNSSVSSSGMLIKAQYQNTNSHSIINSIEDQFNSQLTQKKRINYNNTNNNTNNSNQLMSNSQFYHPRNVYLTPQQIMSFNMRKIKKIKNQQQTYQNYNLNKGFQNFKEKVNNKKNQNKKNHQSFSQINTQQYNQDYNKKYNQEYKRKYNQEYNKNYNQEYNQEQNQEYTKNKNKQNNQKYNKKYNEIMQQSYENNSNFNNNLQNDPRTDYFFKQIDMTKNVYLDQPSLQTIQKKSINKHKQKQKRITNENYKQQNNNKLTVNKNNFFRKQTPIAIIEYDQRCRSPEVSRAIHRSTTQSDFNTKNSNIKIQDIYPQNNVKIQQPSIKWHQLQRASSYTTSIYHRSRTPDKKEYEYKGSRSVYKSQRKHKKKYLTVVSGLFDGIVYSPKYHK